MKSRAYTSCVGDTLLGANLWSQSMKWVVFLYRLREVKSLAWSHTVNSRVPVCNLSSVMMVFPAGIFNFTLPICLHWEAAETQIHVFLVGRPIALSRYLSKVQMLLAWWPTCPTTGIYPRDKPAYRGNKMHTRLFTAASQWRLLGCAF